MKHYFITGTDTDCGKTYATCCLLDYFKQQQKMAFAIKPVASGCSYVNAELHSEDVLTLEKHNPALNYPINPWRFPLAISPHLAAKEEGMRLSADGVAEFCLDQQFNALDYLLIEGAGGLMVPLNEKETWLDFLKLSQIPVIVVVGMRLGCLNHAFLTDAVLQANQISAVGWIANCLDNNMVALEENIETLSTRMQMPLLARIPYRGHLNLNRLGVF